MDRRSPISPPRFPENISPRVFTDCATFLARATISDRVSFSFHVPVLPGGHFIGLDRVGKPPRIRPGRIARAEVAFQAPSFLRLQLS